jgi:hypothetical protein
MFLYLLFVPFAYYIVKPVSRAIFLTQFDIDKLPLLYILIAAFGGIFAYFYSRLATRVSLSAAVTWAMGFSALILVVLWWLIRLRIPSMVYVLNIWVSLFSLILVSQEWLVAGNLFDARQAKRLYPLLDLRMAALAYVAFLRTEFSFGQMIGDISRVRHLQIIVGMMVVMYLVDTLVEYQFQAMARLAYTGDRLTAFFGQFYGLWLNGVEFVFQLFLTGVVGAVVRSGRHAADLAGDRRTVFGGDSRCSGRGFSQRSKAYRGVNSLHPYQDGDGTVVYAVAARTAQPHQSIYRHLRRPPVKRPRRSASSVPHCGVSAHGRQRNRSGCG